MRLYIVRHAIAELRNISSPRDEDRALTPEGVEKMERAARGMKAMDFIPDTILTSPLVRARQTADILQNAFGTGVPIEINNDLAPGGDRGSLYRKIVDYAKEAHGLMIVGHMPSLGEIAGDLACGYQDCFFHLKKGGMCVIDLECFQDEGRGELVSLLTPALLRKLDPE
jgi:phosphohistidine phosphatase